MLLWKRRRLLQIIFLKILILASYTNGASEKPKTYKEVKMNAEDSMRLYQHWVDNAYSGLIAALANQRLKGEPRQLLTNFEQCSQKADSVIKHAQCLQSLIKSQREKRRKGFKILSQMRSISEENKRPNLVHLNRKEEAKNRSNVLSKRLLRYTSKSKRLLRYNLPFGRASSTKVSALPIEKVNRLDAVRGKSGKNDWVSGFRVDNERDEYDVATVKFRGVDGGVRRRKRVVRAATKADGYDLLSPKSTPLGGVANLLTKLLIGSKGKSEVTPWQHTVKRLQMIKEKKDETRKSRLNDAESSEITNGRTFFKGISRDLIKVDGHEDDEMSGKSSARDEKSSAFKQWASLIRSGVMLGYRLNGRNASEVGDKPIRFASPRFLSVVPENGDDRDDDSRLPTRGTTVHRANTSTVNIISPSLFSLHDEGSGLEKELSLPALTKGLSKNEQNSWMNLIMEFSGVNDEVSRMEKRKFEEDKLSRDWSHLNASDLAIESTRFQRDIRSPDGQPLYFTKSNVSELFGGVEERKLNTYDTLLATLSKEQWMEMNATGYAILTTVQIRIFYGAQSPYNNSRALRHFSTKSRRQILSGMSCDLRRTAEAKSFELRLRDIVNSPTYFAPIIKSLGIYDTRILSPLAFSPYIQSPTIMGPLILSPWIFTPLILSPHLMVPLILSPYLFSPVILSPLVMQPNILSPGVFSPFIISPFLLTPSILSPLVFSPLILTPSALSPIILTPTVGNPLILSPYVLSPVLISPQSLGGLFLSPYALSPVLLSPLSFFLAILSPSTLS